MSCRRMAFEGILVKTSSAMWASSSQLNESYPEVVSQLAPQIRSYGCTAPSTRLDRDDSGRGITAEQFCEFLSFRWNPYPTIRRNPVIGFDMY
jgi:hypothetical protein